MKKVLALTLVLVLAFSMSSVAFAATKVDIDVLKGDWINGVTGTIPQESGKPANVALHPDDTYEFDILTARGVNETIIIPLEAEGVLGIQRASTAVTKSEVSKYKLTVRLKVGKGSQVIDSYKITSGSRSDSDAQIEIEFKEPFVSNSEDGVDFAFNVRLLNDGKLYDQTLSFEGNYKNPLDDEEYGKETDYYDFYQRRILKPYEFIPSFEGDLGEGVIFNMRGIKNARYYAYADQEANDVDNSNFIKYRALDAVYHVYSAGNFESVVNYITFEDVDPTAYIYDGNLNYLGRGNEKITVLTDTYYIATAVLDVDTEDEPEEDDDDDDYEPEDWGGNTSTGGDDLYPENPHDNPGTGK